MARQLKVDIIGDSSSYQRALNSAQTGSSRFGTALGSLAKVAAFSAGAAGVGAMAVTLRAGIKEYTESAKVAAQTNAVIESTGGIANVTAKDVEQLSEALMRKSGVDDEAIQSSANLLLGFQNIRNEVGKGNDIFNQATQAVLDYSVRTGKDASSAAVMFGRALNDPITGLGRLARVGITFTDAQKEQIKAMTESGDIMGAQQIILGELEKRYGGAAEAAGKTLPGQLAILKESFNNFAGDLVTNAIPSVQRFVDFINTVLAAPTFKAKLQIVWEGVESAVSDLHTRLTTAIEGIDWANLFITGFQSINWGAVLHGVFNGIITVSKTQWTIISQIWLGAWSAILSGLQALGGRLVGAVSSAMAGAVSAVRAAGASLVTSITTSMSNLVGAITSAAGRAATAAAQLGAKIVSGVVSGLANLGGRVLNKLNDIIRQIAQTAVNAFSAAIAIGSSIISGVVSGLAGLAERVGSAIGSGLRRGVEIGKAALGIKSPSTVTRDEIGIPMGQGVIDGWIRSTAPLPAKMADSVKRAVERARAEIESARERLGTAFDGMAARILRAFDAETGAMETASEARIREIEERRQMEDLIQRQTDAQQRLTEAIQAGDQAAIAAAQRDLARAQEDIALVDLKKQAEQERIQLDSQNEERRLALEKRLDQLKAHFEREGATTKQALNAITKLMRSFQVDFGDAGALLGNAFANALNSAIQAAVKAAGVVNTKVPGTPTGYPSAAGVTPLTSEGLPGSVTVNNYAPITSPQDLEDMVVGALGRVSGRQGFT